MPRSKKALSLSHIAHFTLCVAAAALLPWSAAAQRPTDDQPSDEPREPVSITLIKMDLDGAQNVMRNHDLDDNAALSQAEWSRLGWDDKQTRRFDLNRDGSLQHVEIALKLADARIDDGIVQMDAILADRYTNQYDSNLDGTLSLRELENNTFTDAQESFDKNSDRELSQTELIQGLAFERRFRDELGIKGCDQGGAMKLINRGDRNNDRRIAEDELEQAGLRSSAMDFDRNGDEKLSVSELAEMLADRRNRMGLTPSDQLAARGIMRRFDRDGDGVIPMAELPTMRTDEGTPPNWDLDGDGKVTELELEKSFGDQRKALGFDDQDSDRATTLIRRNDADGSRTLSKSELVASGSDRNSPLSPTKLSLIDEDKNGSIDLKELARYLNKTK